MNHSSGHIASSAIDRGMPAGGPPITPNDLYRLRSFSVPTGLAKIGDGEGQNFDAEHTGRGGVGKTP